MTEPSPPGAGPFVAVLPHDLSGPPPGEAPALLLIHPLGADRRFWDACVAHWRGRFACVAPDLRPRAADGYGGPAPLARHVADLDALLRAVGAARVVPVGTAIGSIVAAAYAARRVGATAALVLTNATPRSSPDAQRMLLDRAAAVRRGGLATVLPEAVDRAFTSQPRDAVYEGYLSRFAAQPAGDYADAVEASASYDASADLPEVRCPTLVCAGEHDVLLPPERSRLVAEAIPGARLEIVAGAAHFVPLQAPEIFARRVADFLDGALGKA